MPHAKSLPMHWRRIPQWYRLEGSVCEKCGEYYFPNRVICPQCRRHGKIVPVKFSGSGEIYSYTVVHVPPTGMELEKPYVLGIIKLAEGPKVTAQIVDCEPGGIKIGQKVEATLRKIREVGDEGIIQYGYKFQLA